MTQSHVAGACTPRTDAVIARIDNMTKGGDAATPAGMMLLIAHAEQLERDLIEEKSEHRATLAHAAKERETLTYVEMRAAELATTVGAQNGEISAMRTAISDTSSDTKRLDWLQLHREDLGITRDLHPGNETIYVDCSVTGVMAYGSTLREAIDAAIKTEAP